ncbi:hypothetical protein TDMWS_11960 [Thermodesulfomicrobium sp. WS]|nr:hypothetical protein TDMWS_11960 [Thermodesulfomicrobium sp. WS]
MDTPMNDTSHAESLAADLFRMVMQAKERGIAVDRGFRNHALESPRLSITYLFLPRAELLKVSAFPPALRRFVRRMNALVCLEAKKDNGRRTTLGIHLLWATDAPLAEVCGPEAVQEELVLPGVAAYTEQVRGLLRADIARAAKTDA